MSKDKIDIIRGADANKDFHEALDKYEKELKQDILFDKIYTIVFVILIITVLIKAIC